MTTSSNPFLLTETGCVPWRATTLRQLSKNEGFLEKRISEYPQLLGLEDRRTHVAGPYVSFHQRRLDTPQGRSAQPDIVFLTESGHVIVVEVKLGDNPELAQRHVVAQVLDYASSLALYSEKELAELFGQPGDQSFAAVVRRIFPAASDPDELSEVLLERIRKAELHLVIACDRAPGGLREFVHSVSNQAALGGYELRVVEIVPYVTDVPSHGVLMIPTCPVRTEVVLRTAVSVTIGEGQPKPNVQVTVSSPEEVEDNVRQARAPKDMRPDLAAAIAAYDALAEPELLTGGTSPGYRQIKVPGWPVGIHYELVSYSTGVGVELHLESEAVRPLGPVLEVLVDVLRPAFPNATWDPNWAAHRGRLLMRPPYADSEIAAQAMRDFIVSTRNAVQAALDNHAPDGN
jgi:hypothetical protein